MRRACAITCGISLALAGLQGSRAFAQVNTDGLTIHITCQDETGAATAGSGVLISASGHILTAKHVLPKGATCSGAIADRRAARAPLEFVAQSNVFDGAILRLSGLDLGAVPFAGYCATSAQGMKGREIVVLGFHPGSDGEPSATAGIISTSIHKDGLLETDAETVAGKSGGPVFLKDTASLVGIVAGAQFNAMGVVVSYAIVPAEFFAELAPMTRASDCAPVATRYTIAQHQAIVDARLTALRADLEHANALEREILLLKLENSQRDKDDIVASFEAREAELAGLRLQLAAINDGRISQDRLSAAQAALLRGETALADDILAQIARAADETIKLAAEAIYLRGRIAEDAVNWREAAEHYARASELDPAYLYLKSAIELAQRSGLLAASEGLGPKLVEAAKAEYGADAEEVAVALNLWGSVLHAVGDLTRAETVFRQAIEIGARTYGAEHAAYARDLNGLAGVFKERAQYAEAEVLYREALRIDKLALGESHPDYATDLNNLAGLLVLLGKTTEAEALYDQALEIASLTVGSSHPTYATRLANLGQVYVAQSRLDEAEATFLKAAEIIDAKLGTDTPIYATLLSNLGTIAQMSARPEEALGFYGDALDIFEKTYGTSHPEYLINASNIASVHFKLGNYAQAEQKFISLRDIHEKTHGVEHPEYAADLLWLGRVYQSTDQIAKAEDMYRKSYEILSRSLGPDHPTVVRVRGEMDLLLEAKGQE